jgi:hypothetical protein
MASPAGDMAIDDAWEYTKSAVLSAWSKTTRRMRAAAAFVLFGYVFTLFNPTPIQVLSRSKANSHQRALSIALIRPSLPSTRQLPALPSVHLDFNHGAGPAEYNVSKVALLIENRVSPILSPLILHFMSVVPPDWRFRFMGSLESVQRVNQSRAIRDAVARGKLDLTYIPANMTTGSQEEISAFLTTLWLYEVVLQPAEWLLVFQTDSMLCANSRQTLNSWLDYDWVGAPWNPTGRFGGNGGLSLRRVSRIIDILRHQQRIPLTDPEDVWLTDRLGHRPGAKLANGTASLTFSGEMHGGEGEQVQGKGRPQKEGQVAGDLIKGIDDWRKGFYEPMGYHTGRNGETLHGEIWGTPEMRKHIWDYCPEVKMFLKMDAEKYMPGDCNNNWKRIEPGWEDIYDGIRPESEMTEMIDGVEYPMLPAGLRPW